MLIDAQLVPLAGVVLSNAKALSPLQSILRVRAEQSLGNLNPIPLIALTGTNGGWVSYSLASADPYVLAATLPGMLLGIFYTTTTISVAQNTHRTDAPGIAFAAICYLCALGTAALLSAEGADATEVFGTLTSWLVLLFYFSPLPVMWDAIRTHTATAIHAPLAAMTMCNAGLWMSYGWHLQDWHIYLPQAVGVVLAAAQLALVATCGGAGVAGGRAGAGHGDVPVLVSERQSGMSEPRVQEATCGGAGAAGGHAGAGYEPVPVLVSERQSGMSEPRVHAE